MTFLRIELCPNIHVEVLTISVPRNMTIFGGRDFKEVIKMEVISVGPNPVRAVSL